MHRYLTMILTILLVVGTSLALIELYASADAIQYPLRASLYYLGTSLLMIFFIIKFTKDISKNLFIMNIILIIIFIADGMLLALICLYALEPVTRIETLASSIFFLSGMIAGSSLFFTRPLYIKGA